MKIVYGLATGSPDATRASLPLHLAVNGSKEIGDDVTIVLMGDGTGWLAGGAIDAAEGLGVPPMRDLFAKVREYEIPVFV